MLVNDGEISEGSYTHFTIINKQFSSISFITPSFAHLTIIEKLHRLHSYFLYTSTWIAKKVIRLQTEGEGGERVVTPPLEGVVHSCS